MIVSDFEEEEEGEEGGGGGRLVFQFSAFHSRMSSFLSDTCHAQTTAPRPEGLLLPSARGEHV